MRLTVVMAIAALAVSPCAQAQSKADVFGRAVTSQLAALVQTAKGPVAAEPRSATTSRTQSSFRCGLQAAAVKYMHITTTYSLLRRERLIWSPAATSRMRKQAAMAKRKEAIFRMVSPRQLPKELHCSHPGRYAAPVQILAPGSICSVIVIKQGSPRRALEKFFDGRMGSSISAVIVHCEISAPFLSTTSTLAPCPQCYYDACLTSANRKLQGNGWSTLWRPSLHCFS